MLKGTYFIQPYKVGTRTKSAGDARSLVLTIPKEVARQCEVTPDSVFMVQADIARKIVKLSKVKLSEGREEKTPPAMGTEDQSA